MHCHSTASEVSRLGVQRAVGLPECATPPEEVYELAKRRGMDFVTITDHDTMAGVLQIAERPDVFVSEELTAHFRGEPRATVHVLCYGIDPDDHEWLQAHRGDVEECAEYLRERESVCALAHPYYTVGAPLTARHRRRLADAFAIWEVRNGARARELNRPAATYVATLRRHGIGGSDDHAGVDIGRTWTETPPARSPGGVPRPPARRTGRARGEQGSAAKWAHAAIALAARTLGSGSVEADGRGGAPDPRTVLTMVQRLLREGDARQGAVGGRPHPRGRPAPAARVARRGRARSPRRARADRVHAGRALHPLRPLSARLPRARAQAARRRGVRGAGCVRALGHTAGGGHRRDGRGVERLRGLRRRDPLRPRRRLPGQREGQARLARGARRRAWRSSPTGSAAHTGSRARSRRSASAACRASRSR